MRADPAGGPSRIDADPDSAKKTARLAGLLYALNGAAGVLGYVVVPRLVLVPGDAAATAANLLAFESLVRLGMASELVSAVALVALGLVLFQLFRGVDWTQASFLVAFVLLAASIMCVIVLDELVALTLVHGAGYLSGFPAEQLDAQALLSLEAHRQGVIVATIFWGLWLFPFGVLAIRSGFFPRVVAILLLLAGFAYVAYALVLLLIPGAGPIVSATSLLYLSLGAAGEGSTVAWLLAKGVKVPPLSATSS